MHLDELERESRSYKFMWRLRPYVMSALKKLQEAGRPLILVCHRAQPFAAHVTKPDEVLLYQHPKSLNSSEVRIKQELGQATDPN